ncbi:hypothetical protein [Haloarcula japonica]|uniref:Uncharacterized protein n=1 Tax=Haloarcula japonica (strain ATCC 49778 / DSM 6131 / JCM 7785 / NBRC 101032 / NCIMB 13157 / TR-1) TaxID=1227453 RepID=M0LLB7_HALJT|nr:hypothetical protein [Haloarcula japonica]EMA32810.1 hypothetical protein C444_06296 [Haloarcula japonica DSM 6131]
MTPARRLIAFHFAIGFGNLLLVHDTAVTLVTASPLDWAVIAVAGLAIAGFGYLSERQRFPESAYSAWNALPQKELTLLVLLCIVLLGAGGLSLLYDSGIWWLDDVVVGACVGLIGYRIVYGLVFPVPEAALGRI